MEGRFISVYGTTKGGSAQIVTAINLSFALKNNLRRQDERVGLADFDFTSYSIFPILVGMEGVPSKSVVALSGMGENLDDTVLPDFLMRHPSGVDILLGIGEGETSSGLKPAGITNIVNMLKKTYSYIIVNAEKEFTDKLILTFDLSNLILLVVNPDVMSIHKAKIFLDDLMKLHYPISLVKVIVNASDTKGALSKSKIEEFLRQPVFFEFPYDKDVVVTSINHGTPAVLSFPRSSFVKSVNALAELIIKNQDIYVEPSEVSSKRVCEVIADTVETAGPVSAAKSNTAADQLRALKNGLQKKLLNEMDLKVFDLQKDETVQKEIREKVKNILERLLSEASSEADCLLPTREERTQFILKLLDEVLGLGPLEPLLRDPTITEIMVNSKDKIFVERNGKITLTNDKFASNDQLKSVIERIVSTVGRHVDESSPLCDARLKDGSRVNAIIPPLALDGPSLTIRKFSEKKLTVDDLVNYNSLTKEMGEFLKICVLTRKNILISGGTGSGKTTLLNILSAFIPPNERIVTIEDSAELKLWQENIVRLEARPSSSEGTGEIPIRRLVINALRMRPDRIVVGECRGGEALDMLQAMNTGHDGSLTTLHANSPRDALSRLETVVLMAGMDLPSRSIKEQIKSAINIIVQLSRIVDGTRKITNISEITGMEGDTITMQEIFKFNQKGISKEGKVIGNYEPTGIIPTFIEELHTRGIKLDYGIFKIND